MTEITKLGTGEVLGTPDKMIELAKTVADIVLNGALVVADRGSRITRLPVVRDYLGFPPRQY